MRPIARVPSSRRTVFKPTNSFIEIEHRRCATEHEHDGYWPEQSKKSTGEKSTGDGKKIDRGQSISRNVFSRNYRQFFILPKPEQLAKQPN
jgi:hypothetical protein